jgi:hypothetical protein
MMAGPETNLYLIIKELTFPWFGPFSSNILRLRPTIYTRSSCLRFASRAPVFGLHRVRLTSSGGLARIQHELSYDDTDSTFSLARLENRRQ